MKTYSEHKPRSFIAKLLRGDPPFNKGDLLECDVSLPSYYQKKGELYTVENCFETKGTAGWNWWIRVNETPVSKSAADFHKVLTN